MWHINTHRVPSRDRWSICGEDGDNILSVNMLNTNGINQVLYGGGYYPNKKIGVIFIHPKDGVVCLKVHSAGYSYTVLEEMFYSITLNKTISCYITMMHEDNGLDSSVNWIRSLSERNVNYCGKWE